MHFHIYAFFLFVFLVCMSLWRDMGELLNLFIFKKQLLDLCEFLCCCLLCMFFFFFLWRGIGGLFSIYLFLKSRSL